ncbi:SDR family NAD(P)-dependent oxidoreductase [Paenibacillus sp. OAS669]|uniref:SDR family NAD(P)-dependent oxidoreductase n=1 Tax=Paenibacillus sp. OAS669 TaxID=2663821 RepID=UPI0017893083|nr:SDR family oxidoreductase [Paenibacillus sp. OAS669]MBE1445663.1 NAD(P)-dependent dehydrogenase (short-subunit alcohol dehydrogenase family) [Paenibacillus sp. OAS669]
MSLFRLDGKKILVTGASSGIGREIAKILSYQGASIILVGRNREKLNETLEQMSSPDKHLIEPFDLSNIDEIPHFLKKVTQSFGTLNGVVHSAGTHSLIPIRAINRNNIYDIMDINFTAGIAIIKSCVQKNICSSNSSIVLISSVTGLVGQAGVLGYAASKGAIISAVKSAAIELASSGLRVNCIVPGIVETDMSEEIFKKTSEDNKKRIVNQHPLGLGKPEDVAFASAYLLSDEAKWITGTALIVDGGYTAH